jgi:hypothetical protein
MNNYILARNIDSLFWNLEYISVDILKALEKNGTAIIHFNTEGPCFQETNLYQLFVYLESVHKVDLSKITIITGNVCEDTAKDYKVIIKHDWMYELKELQNKKINTTKKEDAKKFGFLVGRSNYPRLMLGGHLFSNYSNETFLTFHYDSSSDYHKTHLGLENLIHKFGINSKIVENSLNLIKSSPILKEETPQYPIMQPQSYKTVEWYDNFYIDVICETYFNGNVFFPTEKTWRAIATKTPFIVQGPKDFLKRLKRLGFNTFSNWWDESYDDDPYDYKLSSILKSIDYINRKIDVPNEYKKMESILEENYEVFKYLKTKNIQEIIGAP